jgi:4-hydroxybenzoate polyprenyltransferase
MLIRSMIQLARPSHWIKNLVVLMPIVFGMRLFDIQAWRQAGLATISFCLVSSFAYIFNDIKDRRSDKEHPKKKDRPLASGRIGVGTALVESLVFLVLAFLLVRTLSGILMIMAAIYVLLQVSYSLFLKQKALIDVICIALGFVLRAASGAVAIGVEVSPWLFVCIFTICLFMGFCKRYSEVVTLGDMAGAKNHRPTLIAYTPELLTHLVTISAGIAVIAFLIYGLSERTVNQFGTDYFIYTLPVVVYAVFRFAMLSMSGSYTGPTELILRDRPFQVTIVLWAVLMIIIIIYGKDLQNWVQEFY